MKPMAAALPYCSSAIIARIWSPKSRKEPPAKVAKTNTNEMTENTGKSIKDGFFWMVSKLITAIFQPLEIRVKKLIFG